MLLLASRNIWNSERIIDFLSTFFYSTIDARLRPLDQNFAKVPQFAKIPVSAAKSDKLPARGFEGI
jgi:hypothetical protein